MTNARIIYDNAADRGTTVASSTAGALTAANLRSDIKSKVHRATGNSVAYTTTWASPQSIGGLVLANSRLSATATLRMVGFASADAVPGVTTPLFDTGTNLACAGMMPYLLEQGILPHARLWLEQHYSCQKVYIELIDTGLAQVEASRLILGAYWEMEKNVDYGASLAPIYQSENSRSEAGDLVTDVGPTNSKMSWPMSKLEPEDRADLWKILMGNGRRRPLFVSLFPNSANAVEEQMFQIYGKLVAAPSMTLPSFNLAAATIEIEGV